MLRYTYLFPALITLVLVMTCAGQDKNHYKITGTVVNSATGEPVIRAVVRANGSAIPQVFTDGSGHFEMSDVPEGQITLSAQRPGFLNTEMTGHRPQAITVGPATPAIQIKLIQSPGNFFYCRRAAHRAACALHTGTRVGLCGLIF